MCLRESCSTGTFGLGDRGHLSVAFEKVGHLIVELVLVVLEPLHFAVHVGQHLLVDLQPAFQLDPLLNRVDDLQKPFAVF